MQLHTAATVLETELNARLEDEAGMSSPQFRALWYLANAADRSLTMSEAAARLSMSPSGMTRLADRLADRGWARRMPDPQNRRIQLLSLTDEGAQAARAGYQAATRARRNLIDARLDDDDLRDLRRVTDKLLGRVTLDDVTDG